MSLNDHAGFLVPEWWVREEMDDTDTSFCSILLGFAMATAVFTATKAGDQTASTWRRSRRVTVYIAFIWLEWSSNVSLAIVTWLFQRAYISPSLWLYLGIVFLWCIQIQLLLQIIINRLSLLMVSRQRSKRLKWGIGIFIFAVNISVFIIWTPARLQINPTWIAVNAIWDRIEKALFAIVDIGLNIYFVYLVRSQLINNGLTKYTRLFQVNLIMIGISSSLDVIIIGTMSMKNSLVYLQFHPVAYLLKLAIEMNMADLIVKVVRATNPRAHLDGSYSNGRFSYGTKVGGRRTSHVVSGAATAVATHATATRKGDKGSDGDQDIELGDTSRSSSTRELRHPDE
ncbi:hypothetical protein GQ53DRAFT_883580 [Thozetella sp. PMI_491]|nr:hypothetical protein GQ53DRAFT_883580 [Thozetella sp. PMI_491]